MTPALLRRRLLGHLVGASLLTATQALRAASQPAAAPDLKRLQQRGELRIALPAFDLPPFFHHSDGQLQGIDIDIAHGIASALDLPPRFIRQARSFNEVVEQVARGDADLAVGKLSQTLKRARLVRFSEPYIRSRHALLLNRVAFARHARGEALAPVLRRFTGTLGVLRGSSFADQAPVSFPEAGIRPYDNWESLIEALNTGKIVAAYRDELEMQRLLRERPALALTLRLVALTDTQDNLAVVLPHDAPQLLALVNLYLAQRPPLDPRHLLSPRP